MDIREHKIELWPGYITSIRRHEHDILMSVEINYKVMRQETVYDMLMQCRRSLDNWPGNFLKMVLGTTVLTAYNNKTYRIDDVDFDTNPSNSFETKNGPQTFVQYYHEVI